HLLYLVMELFVGSDLSGLIRDEAPLEIARGGRIVAQVLSALEDAHAIGLIHRDIKPENVLVGKRGDGSEVAKLCDFGIAKVAQGTGRGRGRDHEGAGEEAGGALAEREGISLGARERARRGERRRGGDGDGAVHVVQNADRDRRTFLPEMRRAADGVDATTTR